MNTTPLGEREVYYLLLGELMQQLRERAGLRQGTVAAQSGMSQSMLSRLERGQAHLPLSTLHALAPALGLADSVEFLDVVDNVWQRAGQAARVVIGLPAEEKDWWTPAQQVAGTAIGVAGLLRFVVACALGQRTLGMVHPQGGPG